MKRTLILLSIVILSYEGMAQIATMQTNTGDVIRERKYVDVEGSPYLFSEYQSGTFTDVDGKDRGEHKIRYNIYDDELEVIREGKEISLNNRIVKEFHFYSLDDEKKISASTFRSGFPENEEYSEKNFYQVLSDNGKYKLLKKHSCTITQYESKGYGESNITKKFLTSTKYYIYSEQEGFQKFSKSKKSLYEIFPDKESDIKAYIKSEKLNIKNDDDLAIIVEYCNEKG